MTISRERAGEKRQSVVKLMTRNLASACGHGGGQIAAVLAGRVEVVERAGDQQVGVGVKVVAELVALVAQVAFHLELDVLGAVVGRIAQRASHQFAAELLFHHVVGQVGDVADHARHAQAAARHHAVRVESGPGGSRGR